MSYKEFDAAILAYYISVTAYIFSKNLKYQSPSS